MLHLVARMIRAVSRHHKEITRLMGPLQAGDPRILGPRDPRTQGSYDLRPLLGFALVFVWLYVGVFKQLVIGLCRFIHILCSLGPYTAL